MKQLEDRFNNKFNYPYVFLNNVPFAEEFKQKTRQLTKAHIEFGEIPEEHWSYPNFIDQEKVIKSIENMNKENMTCYNSEYHRHMFRYESGFFFRHNMTLKYDYYWKVDPGADFTCDIDEDPFLYMYDNDKKYGFTLSLYEYSQTIPTLCETVNKWINLGNDTFPEDNALDFISYDKGRTYSMCHFWPNFEIASFDLWRDSNYLDYFDFLDKKAGFFYERWSDAPVHSIYVGLTLPREKIHFFNSIGYQYQSIFHCPIEKDLQKRCYCDPDENFDYAYYSCTARWFALVLRR